MKVQNVIPPMTHELSKAWHQPETKHILIDDTHAVMDSHTFDQLHNYSSSVPSGCYEGKMWRALLKPNLWLLRWFDFSDKGSDFCTTENRIILIA